MDYLVDDVIVYHLRYDAHAIIRTPAQVATGLSDGISVQLHRRGSIRGAVGEVDLYAAPDRIVLQDLAHPFSVWTDDSEVIGVIVPSCVDRLPRLDPHPRAGHLLALSTAQPAASSRLPSSTLLGRASAGRDVGRTAARELVGRAPQWPLATESGITKTMFAAHSTSRYASTSPTISTTSGSTSTRCDGSSSARVRRSIACSKETAGWRSYIRDACLRACMHDLALPSTTRKHVALIATRWGFENPSHFNRLFKQSFGVVPSAVGGLTLASNERPRTRYHTETLNSWVTQLAPRDSV